MWRNLLNRVIVPLLFVAAAVVLSVRGMRYSAAYNENIKALQDKETYVISPYDDMFRRVGADYNVDWLLLSAIARAESEFRFDAISKAGAVGLMQIMPVTAKSMGYEREQLFEAEVSAVIAAQLLHENNNMLRLASDFDSTERLRFILACYNAGYSRVADARRLARYHRENADCWSVVAKYLSLMSDKEYYEHKVVRSGEFVGSEETIAYVSKVIHIYKVYKAIVSQFEER